MIYLFTSLSDNIHYFYDNGYIIVCNLRDLDGSFYKWLWKDDYSYVMHNIGDVDEIRGFDISLPSNLSLIDIGYDNDDRFFYALSKSINNIIFNI